jgi:hypothetical protein
MTWVDTLVAEGKDDFTLLCQLEVELPQKTFSLRERALRVNELLVSSLRVRLRNGHAERYELARALNNLGLG